MELSQEEITEFTQALGSNLQKEHKPERVVKSYDFMRPDKLSRAHIRVLQSLLSGLERSWTASLSSMLRCEATSTLISIEQVTCSAYLSSIPDNGLIVELSLGSLTGTGLLSLSGIFALSAVDRLAGGKGNVQGESRNFSEIEKRIIGRLLGRLAVDISAMLRPVTNAEISVHRVYDFGSELEIDPEQMLLAAGFNLSLPAGESRAALAFPVDSFDSIRDHLTPEYYMQGKTPDKKQASNLASELLDNVRVDTAVELGRALVSLSDIAGIGVGDIIRLNSSAGDLLTICVQGRPKFYGRPGLVGNKLAVQITESAQESPPQEAYDKAC